MHSTVGTEAKRSYILLKDIFSFLALVSAVRENFERHLQAEHEMIKYCFAFDRIIYPASLSARTTTYQ